MQYEEYDFEYVPKLEYKAKTIKKDGQQVRVVKKNSAGDEKAIIDNEPRALLNRVRVSPNLDRNAFDVTIIFTPTNSPAPVKVEISLERIR